MKIERHATTIRVALIYLAVTMGWVAIYILVAPRTFYDDFPGWAQWVSALPPYNEHLLRDFGAAGLGLTVLVVLAAVWMDRRLVQAAAVAIFVGTLPHAIYHSTTTEHFSTADNLLSLGGLYLQALLPLAILYLASAGQQRRAARPAPAPTRP
ncbi:MAG TPA: hypothetical protein VHH72_02345 [Solirubrobacterales bacterium]|jgi:hypothetical protein|nr:hypothetical protein [Solirubrobacterales bacterium]